MGGNLPPFLATMIWAVAVIAVAETVADLVQCGGATAMWAGWLALWGMEWQGVAK
ncbi:hypothetical protein [Rubellimicrobium sp. CFH 75288]|uniref:hypothetical protein n=1 Tax=Rubellimicrobium sp. CFH 75288 TaxID=2697034 RepID=UPI00141333C0|nr:hypothetical protein [Rubellimicrobium sp. CFH 75288]NAZ37195.1 hypothetical protein [Rubellimicrobium sp. CFH 75288]